METDDESDWSPPDAWVDPDNEDWDVEEKDDEET